MMGAMTFSSAGGEKRRQFQKIFLNMRLKLATESCNYLRTNKDESHGDAKCEEVATQGFVVFAVAFSKTGNARVNVVFA